MNELEKKNAHVLKKRSRFKIQKKNRKQKQFVFIDCRQHPFSSSETKKNMKTHVRKGEVTRGRFFLCCFSSFLFVVIHSYIE